VPNVKNRESTGRHAFLVAAGILISRIVGLVRQRVFNGYFGLTDTADAFASALRIPNFLQNLFGEGVLSASFIPVYSRLLAEGDDEEADRVAGAVGAILALSMSVLVLLGVAVTPYLMWAIAPGYAGPKRELTILLVRILFPGAGLLVCSAWCLGILNSHRKFFLSYTAPVVWNLAMIGTMWAFRHSALNATRLRAAVRRTGAGGPGPCAQATAAAGDAVGQCRGGAQELRAGGGESRRGTDQRVCGPGAGLNGRRRRHGCDDHRTVHLHVAGESVRHGGIGG
jgi:peptidoglycan biosynthesis protein MviN/MurJ (putative lipid II flippase)